MERLLARKGIKAVSFVDTDGIIYRYFYTDQLLAQKIFIEFYEFENQDIDYDPADPDDPKFETGITAFLSHQNESYEFIILLDTRPFIPALYSYRILLDLVEIIENSEPSLLIKNLHHAATSVVSTKVLRNDEITQKEFAEKTNEKITFVMEMIDELKSKTN